jgi:hypothetical protein
MPVVIRVKLREYVTEQAADEIAAELERREDVAEASMSWSDPAQAWRESGAGVSR